MPKAADSGTRAVCDDLRTTGGVPGRPIMPPFADRLRVYPGGVGGRRLRRPSEQAVQGGASTRRCGVREFAGLLPCRFRHRWTGGAKVRIECRGCVTDAVFPVRITQTDPTGARRLDGVCRVVEMVRHDLENTPQDTDLVNTPGDMRNTKNPGRSSSAVAARFAKFFR
ncbi:hypothetical protein GCM10010420_36430 [Streptomyces glaucosporus]|uniref:Uncharacterized protein n=1 Tax=Streptomyces glaucosporus TaxID=284044 RepID=A0ABN3IHU6_9ACTN